ncbi:hypothetical protein LACPH_000959 [Lacticaseibacillus parahuelsenbergensis]|uniref:PRC-barrel domain-containing protein n=1 Tax=Lacticaseibacillus parahuelsenbergensis TaxID=3068305 RepID=A0ABY9L632_9LACO|nr:MULTISPECIES: hypothetical protein [Lacticaseibacillus]MDE3282019.1 hypothetical protein [Lacticaseibacillus casei]WLV78933.1 hypothetical protein LACPH_000959 [Lacticaseibacillus sp. NCIMB 15471]
MKSYLEYLGKQVLVSFVDGDELQGKVTDAIDADETDDGLPYMTIIPSVGCLTGQFIGVDANEIKSIKVIE